ncbi:vanadium-dependent haloperoxidase [Spirosoma fluviale]|uniref:PAP2 superfamily protein n=1 Tax=Spirosoma fluviale TaxID=1597977 RepID=A0A286G563_9BACT|nr:vanadium-dependent haloperoxidase [Spirosoma fluviale]SOD90687.1 PAP2 superfamily protein [Spirosoma fluviale]
MKRLYSALGRSQPATGHATNPNQPFYQKTWIGFRRVTVWLALALSHLCRRVLAVLPIRNRVYEGRPIVPSHSNPANRRAVGWVLFLVMGQGILCTAPAQGATNGTRTQKGGSPSAAVATAWADLTVQTMKTAPKNTPTYGSRALGYLGITMYETVVRCTPGYRSIARQLCDTLVLPTPVASQRYCPELALNAGQAYMLRALYGYTNKLQRIDSLATAIHNVYAAQNPPDVVKRSEAYGRAVAEKIYRWSLSDGGYDGHTQIFPKDYILPAGTGLWTPPLIGQTKTKIPMHPTWGQNRTFAPLNGQLPLVRPLPYSTDSASAYYQEYKLVWLRSRTLTEAERETVLWWGDDPNETCSPPGHSYNLATAAIRKTDASLIKAALTYCRVGMAVADAFIVCWKTKFAYLVERPSTFIRAVIQHPDTPSFEEGGWWLPFFPEPPFPSFFSGHATQSAAMATVLTDLYGDHFSFTDNTHAGRAPKWYTSQQDEYKQALFTPRSYTSFWEAAHECAESRLMGGIHTRYDNEVGLVEGRKIGQHINRLHWK